MTLHDLPSPARAARPARLPALAARRPRLVLVAWVVAVLAGVLAAPGLFARLSPDAGGTATSESSVAARLLWEAQPRGEEVYAVADGRAADDPALERSVRVTAEALRALPGVAEVSDPYTSGVRELVALDGRAVALTVRLDAGLLPEGTVDAVAAQLRGLDAPTVLVGGGPLLDDEMNAQAAHDLARAELLSMPVVLVLLLVLFGGVVAAGLPVVVALVGVATTLLGLGLLTLVTDVSVYAINVVTMLGLGLAVDYALLVVTRFREERAADPADCSDVRPALARTVATAGRTVAFSGLTVAASLAGLLVFSDDFLRSMGAAGIVVVLLDVLAALTLLPALLVLVGHRLRPARTGARPGGLLVRLARLTRSRPAVVVVVLAGVLLLAGTPFLGVRFADADARSMPASSPSRQLADLAESRFGVDPATDPVVLVSRGPLPAQVREALPGLPGVLAVTEREDVPGLTVVDVLPEGSGQGPVATALVEQVRALPDAPLVTGAAARLVDTQGALLDRLPWALLVVAGATLVLLFAFTGSVVLPVKAVLMNVLSLGASFGALVWVFQDGHLGWLVGTEALGSLALETPVLVFAIAFGLSMDYEVFLLGRVREEHLVTGDTDLAVERGLASTGRTITSAALLVVVVFAGFVAGGFSPVKQVGLGLVVAVAVDVTLVRMLLVPAAMRLMGEWNWWAPAPLRRLHERIGLTEAPAAVLPPPRVREPQPV